MRPVGPGGGSRCLREGGREPPLVLWPPFAVAAALARSLRRLDHGHQRRRRDAESTAASVYDRAVASTYKWTPVPGLLVIRHREQRPLGLVMAYGASFEHGHAYVGVARLGAEQ